METRHGRVSAISPERPREGWRKATQRCSPRLPQTQKLTPRRRFLLLQGVKLGVLDF